MTEPIKVRRIDFYPADYLEGISDLDDERQVAVYTVAFMAMYARGGPIANDARWINRMAKCRTSTGCRTALDQLIAKGKLFVTDDGRLMNGRTARELVRATGRVQSLRDRGTGGGRPTRLRDVRQLSSTRSRRVAEMSSSESDNEQNQSLKKPNGLPQASSINHQPTDKKEDVLQQQPLSVAAREPQPEPEAAAAAAAFDLWREAASAHGWPDPQFMNSTRRFAIGAMLAIGGGLDGWRAAIDKAASAKFLRDSAGAWHHWFDLDWFIKAEHFTRLMEGRYDHERKAANQRASVSSTIAAFRRQGDR